MKVLDRNNIQIEIWERGAGYTLASGSSSSAAAAVAHRLGLCDREISVHMPGGIIDIEIGDDYAIRMTGAVTKVADGVIAKEIFRRFPGLRYKAGTKPVAFHSQSGETRLIIHLVGFCNCWPGGKELNCDIIMKKLAVVIWCALVVLGILLLLLIAVAGMSYNHLVKLSQAVDSQWAQVQNVYQRRADLIPNLVATVSGAANFEKSTLTEITAARASVGQVKIDPNTAPSDPAKLAAFDQAQGQLSSALSRLLVVVERYPDLKATENFRDLQAQLEGTENRISVERRDFNTAVQNYNTAIKSFPAVFYAGAFGFHDKPYFAATAGSRDTAQGPVRFQSTRPRRQPTLEPCDASAPSWFWFSASGCSRMKSFRPRRRPISTTTPTSSPPARRRS